MARVVALQVDLADRVGALEAAHLGDEAQAPGLAPEFTVGHEAEAKTFLPGDDLGDAFVGEPRVGEQPFGPEQAADVLGAKGRRAHAGQR